MASTTDSNSRVAASLFSVSLFPLSAAADSGADFFWYRFFLPGLLLCGVIAVFALVALSHLKPADQHAQSAKPIRELLISANKWPAYVAGPTTVRNIKLERDAVLAAVESRPGDEVLVLICGSQVNRFRSTHSDGDMYAFTLRRCLEVEGLQVFEAGDFQLATKAT